MLTRHSIAVLEVNLQLLMCQDIIYLQILLFYRTADLVAGTVFLNKQKQTPLQKLELWFVSEPP